MERGLHMAQAEVVREVYALYADGVFDTEELAEHLNREGVPTPRELMRRPD
uniref:hypothetical protein n=1 Tax=Microbispora cellulosiformans TaxID=2614688 RepID=UPI00177CE86B|nr:hypothetical protein [Microbispora cellulosiformans]